MANLLQKFKFQFLVNIFQYSKDDFSDKIEKVIQKLNTDTMNVLLDMTVNNKQIMISLKWLILMHFISLQGSDKHMDIRNDILIQLKVDYDSLTSFQQVLYKKLFIPYKMYIQKRNYFQLVKQSQQIKVYQILNLIRMAISFTNVMYLLGRYVVRQHQFLRYFCVLIAKDMRHLYKLLRFNLTQKMCIQNAQVLQKMNEGLYNIYYNCYFSKYISNYAPVWLNTQSIFKLIENQSPKIKKNINKNIVKKVQKQGRTTWHQLQDKQTQKSMIFDMFDEKNQTQMLSLQQMPSQDSFSLSKLSEINDKKIYENDKQMNSNSTIASNKDSKQQIGKQSQQTILRLQFIAMASKLMQEIQVIESQTNIL